MDRNDDDVARRMLARAAHDLAQPLNAIVAAAQVVRSANDRTAVDRAVLVIDRQTQYLREFVARLLDGAREHRWHATQRFVPVDVRELVAQVIEANRLPAAQRWLDISGDTPDGPVWVDGDPLALQEIVWNLLDNALRYTPQGGRILVQVSENDAQVVIAVRDTGIGLEPREIRTIFGAFVQGERGHQKGMGLGLAIAWELARAHGGTIDARSAGRDRGSEFRLTLPSR